MAKETAKKMETAEAVQSDTDVKNTSVNDAAPKIKKGKAAATDLLMYVGPTVSGIGIQNRVYTEMPKDAEEKAREVPEIRQLFIPVKNYPIANKMLREKKGYIYSAFRKVGAVRNGGNES